MKKKVKVKIKPRIKEVFDKVLETNGKSVSGAMKKLNYAKSTCKNPQQITRSKSWAMLLKQIPDQKLINVLNDGLEANRQIGAMILIKNAKNGRTEQILKDNEGMIEVADHQTRHKFLETGLKMKGKLVEGVSVEGNDIVVNIIKYGNKDKKCRK